MEGRGPVAKARCDKAGAGSEPGHACHRRRSANVYNARHDRDKSRMRESQKSESAAASTRPAGALRKRRFRYRILAVAYNRVILGVCEPAATRPPWKLWKPKRSWGSHRVSSRTSLASGTLVVRSPCSTCGRNAARFSLPSTYRWDASSTSSARRRFGHCVCRSRTR